jgi:GNAT superfamily N-acetyltransferase
MPVHDFQFSELNIAHSGLVRDHLRSLDADSRTMRFGAAVTEAFLEAYAERLATLDAVTLGAFHDGSLCALAELHRLRLVGSRDVELALSVEPRWQGCGIGRDLATFAASRAAESDGETLHACFSSCNHRMRAIALRLGMRLVHDGWSVIGSANLHRCRDHASETGERRHDA